MQHPRRPALADSLLAAGVWLGRRLMGFAALWLLFVVARSGQLTPQLATALVIDLGAFGALVCVRL